MTEAKHKSVLRFITSARHPPYGHRTGIFAAAYELTRQPDSQYADELSILLQWFADNLPAPDKLTRSRHPRAGETAISWIKDTAFEHIEKIRELTSLLEMNGVRCEMISTDRPGYVVYEDAFQIAALPFSDTMTE